MTAEEAGRERFVQDIRGQREGKREKREGHGLAIGGREGAAFEQG